MAKNFSLSISITNRFPNGKSSEADSTRRFLKLDLVSMKIRSADTIGMQSFRLAEFSQVARKITICSTVTRHQITEYTILILALSRQFALKSVHFIARVKSFLSRYFRIRLGIYIYICI